MSIGFLFVTQMMTTVQNITTLESFTEGIESHNPWDKGSWASNMREIFGEENWMIPTHPFPPMHSPSPSTTEVVDL